MLTHIGHIFTRIPLPVRVLLGIAVVMGAFVNVVGPLFNNSGPPVAEIGGLLPPSLPGSSSERLNLDIDNTGYVSVKPVCVAVSTTNGAVATSVTFQGLDQVAVTNGRACGGQLGQQESISIVIAFDLSHASSLNLSVTPEQGSLALGKPLTGVIAITH